MIKIKTLLEDKQTCLLLQVKSYFTINFSSVIRNVSIFENCKTAK
jgi:hypothetical protein